MNHIKKLKGRGYLYPRPLHVRLYIPPAAPFRRKKPENSLKCCFQTVFRFMGDNEFKTKGRMVIKMCYDNNRETAAHIDKATNHGSSGKALDTPAELIEKRRPKKPLRRALFLAALAACMAVSGAAGAGTTYLLMMDEPQAQSSPQTAQQDNYTLTSASNAGDVTAVVEKAADNVVEITTETKQVNPFASQYVTEGAGSGVVLNAAGYIVTNYHVIEGANTIEVRTADGTEYPAELIGLDKKTDLAVLKINADNLTPVEFADSDAIKVGQAVVAIGNPLGELGGTVTNGIISAKDREITIDGQNMTLLQTSAAVSPGNSGGGLFDSDGRLVGVVNAKSSGTDIEGLAFAIPSNTVQEVAEEIMANGYVTGRPQIGIGIVEITDAREASRYRVSEPGVYVSAVSQSNGLEEGDLIVSVDDTEIESGSDVTAVLDKHSVGDMLAVVVKRGGSQITVDVTLTEQTP